MIKNESAQTSDEFLDQARLQGDFESDQTLSEALHPWSDDKLDSAETNLKVIHDMMSRMKSIRVNHDIEQDVRSQNSEESSPESVRLLAKNYLSRCGRLPPWADLDKITRAEELFQDSGVLSCVLFFCSSLPEVYVIPDISTVLHATGNLERITNQRIRSTAVMILSVMMPGGLKSPQGSGQPQVLRARYIHSAIRNLILRENPFELLKKNQDKAKIPPIATTLRSSPPRNMFEMTLSHGWNPNDSGIPINQEELGYTLLTFSYVYLRSLRRLGLRFSSKDEEAYLHCWNVVGALMGIDRSVMVDTMEEGRRLFEKMQKRARARPLAKDTRPDLGQALINSIETSIRFRALKPMASLITKYLTSEQTAIDLGFNDRIHQSAQMLFATFTKVSWATDRAVRLALPEFSLSRFMVRIVGYQLLHKVLTDQNQPLDLPPQLRTQINQMLHEWSHDPKAPAWLNRLEDFFTTHGSWTETISA